MSEESHFQDHIPPTAAASSSSASTSTAQIPVSEPKEFFCGICLKDFRSKRVLNQHLLTHSVEKPYKCSRCSFTTNTRGNLAVHEKTHTGVKPYKCRFCPYTAINSSSRARHLKKYHTTPTFIPCTRVDCHYVAKSQQESDTHCADRHGISCDLCFEKFSDDHDFTLHGKQEHGKDRPFKCPLAHKKGPGLCEYRAKTRTRLKAHMKSHRNQIMPSQQNLHPPNPQEQQLQHPGSD